MKKIVRLTEADLVRIVKKVIAEEEGMPKKLRGNYRIRNWGPDTWHDEDDRSVNPLEIEDYEEEVEFGPNDYEKFLDYTKDIPNPELLIRTSGERRVSNFLLWQIAYAELYFTETLWPDFKKENLYEAIIEYQKRERRFGKTSEQLS